MCSRPSRAVYVTDGRDGEFRLPLVYRLEKTDEDLRLMDGERGLYTRLQSPVLGRTGRLPVFGFGHGIIRRQQAVR